MDTVSDQGQLISETLYSAQRDDKSALDAFLNFKNHSTQRSSNSCSTILLYKYACLFSGVFLTTEKQFQAKMMV